MNSFYKALRSAEHLELLQHPNAYTLLALIAIRAKRDNAPALFDMQPGEALIGDLEACGLTRKAYRHALKQLTEWGYITTRGANKGTIAKLINTTVFDINVDDRGHQGAIKRAIKRATKGPAKPNGGQEVTPDDAPGGASQGASSGATKEEVLLKKGDEEIRKGDAFYVDSRYPTEEAERRKAVAKLPPSGQFAAYYESETLTKDETTADVTGKFWEIVKPYWSGQEPNLSVWALSVHASLNQDGHDPAAYLDGLTWAAANKWWASKVMTPLDYRTHVREILRDMEVQATGTGESTEDKVARLWKEQKT